MEHPEYPSIQGLITLVERICRQLSGLMRSGNLMSGAPHLKSKFHLVRSVQRRLTYALSGGELQYTVFRLGTLSVTQSLVGLR